MNHNQCSMYGDAPSHQQFGHCGHVDIQGRSVHPPNGYDGNFNTQERSHHRPNGYGGDFNTQEQSHHQPNGYDGNFNTQGTSNRIEQFGHGGFHHCNGYPILQNQNFSVVSKIGWCVQFSLSNDLHALQSFGNFGTVGTLNHPQFGHCGHFYTKDTSNYQQFGHRDFYDHHRILQGNRPYEDNYFGHYGMYYRGGHQFHHGNYYLQGSHCQWGDVSNQQQFFEHQNTMQNPGYATLGCWNFQNEYSLRAVENRNVVTVSWYFSLHPKLSTKLLYFFSCNYRAIIILVQRKISRLVIQHRVRLR